MKVNYMKTFKDYLEEKEYEQLNEGMAEKVASILGKFIGISTAGVLAAWIGALLFKGGSKAIDSFSKTLGKRNEEFKRNFRQEVRESPAIKKELNEMNNLNNKYEEELAEVITPLREKDFSTAAEVFKNLPREKQTSSEIKRFIIEEIVRITQQIPVSSPTPGNQSYQIIKKFYDLATAKAVSEALQKEALKYISHEE